MSPKTLDVQLARLLLPLTTLLVWLALLGEVQGFKYHEACHAPPMDMKTRFPLYRLEVDTKITGIPWAYRQNNTIKVSIKALYQKYKIKRLFISVPTMSKATVERPAKKLFLGQWKWQMKGGVIPLDCSNRGGGFSSGANAVRDLWWFKDGFYNVTAEWDPLNTIYNAYKIDMINFEAFVSPDSGHGHPPHGHYGPPPENRWVKLLSDKFVNLDYIDLHRYLQVNPHFMFMMGGLNS